MAGKQYDVDPQVIRNLEDKAKRRTALRNEYFKHMTNPHRHGTAEGGYLFEPGIQRFMSLKATGYDSFKPTPRSGFYAFGLVVAPIALYAWWIKSQRDSVEKKLRNGEIAYRDRKFKFT
ncbi:NADH dehydrogenase [ubiquinone] 1 beta subcomplex subunit 4 [Ischnura elegans]|uniref:NADH dehydrogenase [ubiquinone] 1 beta subcomplex subunit 4 n=1 Tax=Ischnura elegans TaxID=197161 RepID=UPI001ED89EEB|nr:NADH dehydrogenase [ubiquinone] 1 beta subcomplex subunit 4 [Ischnura elegans]